MKQYDQKEFYHDCESICFECGAKPFWVKGDGVALCFWHTIEDFWNKVRLDQKRIWGDIKCQ